MINSFNSNVNPLTYDFDIKYLFIILPLTFVFDSYILNSIFIFFITFINLLSVNFENLKFVRIISWLFLLLFGITLIFKSQNTNIGLLNYAHHFILPFLLFSTITNLEFEESFIKYLMISFIISGVILSLYSVLVLIESGFNFKLRIPSLWKFINMISGYLMICLIFCITFLINEKSFYLKILNTLIIFLIITGILLTQTRAIFVSIFLGLFVFIVKKPRILIPVIIVLSLTFLLFNDLIIDRILSIFFFTKDISSIGRIQAWLTSYTLIKQNLFFGYGFETFEALRDNVFAYYFVLVVNSHNTYLHLIFETGLISATVFLSFYFSAIFKTFSLIKDNINHKYIKIFLDSSQIILISFMFAFIFEPYFSIYGGATSYTLWIIIALIYNLKESRVKS